MTHHFFVSIYRLSVLGTFDFWNKKSMSWRSFWSYWWKCEPLYNWACMSLKTSLDRSCAGRRVSLSGKWVKPEPGALAEECFGTGGTASPPLSLHWGWSRVPPFPVFFFIGFPTLRLTSELLVIEQRTSDHGVFFSLRGIECYPICQKLNFKIWSPAQFGVKHIG